MLKLNTGDSNQLAVERAIKKAKLSDLKRNLQLYFGFISKDQISEALALRQVIGARNRQQFDQGVTSGAVTDIASIQAAARNIRVETNQNLVQVFSDIVDDGDDARKMLDNNGVGTNSIKGKIQESLQQTTDPNLISEYARCINIHYCTDAVDQPRQNLSQIFNANSENRIFFNELENAVPTNNLEVKKRIAVARMEHPLLMPGEKNAELLSVFFNSFPTLELTRATPVMNVKMFSSREMTKNGRLSAITLQKFTEGAVEELPETNSNQALRAMNLASQVTASLFGNTEQNFQNYTITGLELFRAPQTLQNLEAVKAKQNYLAPIIDPMRPLASIKSFSVDIKSSMGLQQTKTGTLEIVLHDRSRLGEFADFVKPDRYGTSFIEIEYGWSHPDPLDADNPYANLLNLTRTREHYNIVTSTLNFDEVGQVNITLNLLTRGSAESTEMSIIGPEAAGTIQTQIRRIQELARVVNQLSEAVFPQNNGNGGEAGTTFRQEIRGVQALSAAQDAVNNLVIPNSLLNEAATLRSYLQSVAGTNSTISTSANNLRETIDNLIGQVTSQGGRATRNTTGVIGELQTTVNQQIRDILQGINNVGNQPTNKSNWYNDTFLKTLGNGYVWSKLIETNGRILSIDSDHQDETIAPNLGNQLLTGNESASAGPRSGGLNINSWTNKKVVSLGTLITAFVAKPLAELVDDNGFAKFAEVQVLFYNFNNKASLMSRCNISQFPVSTKFFAREYSRLRLENVSRAVNLSINEFINFIATRIVDDVMNPAYKISDLYKSEQDQRTVVDARTFDVQMLQRMTEYNIGRHPDFVMPQITFEVEAVPMSEQNGKTILKIHIYDRTCSSKSSFRELLALGTNNFMASLSSIPGSAEQAGALLNTVTTPSGSQTVQQRRDNISRNWSELYSSIISEASGSNLIRQIGVGPNNAPEYQYVGGPQRLKQLVMKNVPHIIYGAMGTTIKSANLSSVSDSLLSSMHMRRSVNANPILPNGAQSGGVPLTLYPLELTMTSVGCSMLRIGQEVFIDFNTNTSADNIYVILGVQHKVEAGSFETTIKFNAIDAFGQYRNLVDQLNKSSETLRSLGQAMQPQQQQNQVARPTPAPAPAASRAAARPRRVQNNNNNNAGNQAAISQAAPTPPPPPAAPPPPNPCEQSTRLYSGQLVEPVTRAPISS